MGHYEGWAQPSGLLPNGLLPNEEASVTRVLDMERWSKAEERTAQLIACIRPNEPSEERRNAVAYYVQRLVKKCFSCQGPNDIRVFTFGSVPLKTYLPDGDIDLTAFSMNQNLKDTWAQEVRDMLENEEKSENAEFHVKEVQYIQAEVKIIKCLVENIVVDISFNQLGGLCTLCFLQEVDHLINNNHLFKRSIILIKAWCYYESRILGAHHGLISTYALETLVLYIFHVFNNFFAGPLEVLYRFLEFFSNFDWDNFCVSLWGPVPISSLPQMTAEPPRRDNGELLLSKPFLDDCNLKYAVFPGGQENQGQPFVSKHFNVIDPLRTNNNLGRSVSKGNFYRIRSAFAFGAKRLARLLECPKENLINEIDQFFMNTWDRHGNGHRPDAPSPDLCPPLPLNPASDDRHENSRNHTVKRKGENVRLPAAYKSQADGTVAFHVISAQLNNTVNHPFENMSRINNMPTVSHTQSHTIYNNQNKRRTLDQVTRDLISSETNQTMHPEKGQRSSRQDYLVNEHEEQARYHFARTQSSPELTDMCGEVLSRLNQNWLHETGKNQFSSVRPDQIGRRKNTGPEVSTSQSTRSSTDDLSSLRRISSHQSLEPSAIVSNGVSNSYHNDASGLAPIESATETIDIQQEMMHQEEQDLINMMASSRLHSFNGQVQVPMSFASAHLPVPVSPGVLGSMGYAQRNVAAMVPATNIHYVEPTWESNIHFTQGLVSSSIPQYLPAGLASNPEEVSESGNENSCLPELNQEDGHSFWNEHETGPSRGFDPDDASVQMLQSDNRQSLISSRVSSPGSSSTRSQHTFVKGNRRFPKEGHGDISQHQNNAGNDYSSDRNTDLRFLPATQASPSRSKPVSESSWDGSYMKVSKSTRDKRGKKTVSSAVPSAAYRKVKTGGWQHENPLSEHVSSLADEDNQEWIPLSATGRTEMTERSMQLLSVATPHDHQLPSYDLSRLNGSDSMIPISPMLVGSSSRPRTLDNNGAVPFAAFYPTGPPVPFLTMLPVYNFPPETANSDGSTNHFDRDDGSESSHVNQPDQNFNLAESLDQSEIFSNSAAGVVPVEPTEPHKPDILNSDFLSHLQNLQFGRLCQNRSNGPWIYPSPVMVPPVYLQGHFPRDGPGRPLVGNVNLFTQLMSYGNTRLVPVAPLQSGSNRPVGAFQHFGDQVPRYRGGTGTYLPNPKVAFRDRQSSTKSHRGNYNYDKNDHADREGNWNFSSKPRAAGRNHARNQPEKPSSRPDRLTAADCRADRPYRHEPAAAHQVQNGPFSSAHSIHSSANVSYGLYPMPPINSNGLMTPTGPAVPSVVMLCSYDHNVGYGSQTEQLEFGSLGRFHMNEALQLGDSSQLRTVYEQRHSTYQGSSALSSPDQPSSPQLQRSAAQRIYRLKDEDFPPLSFPDQGGNSGGISYSSKSSHYQTFLSNPSHS